MKFIKDEFLPCRASALFQQVQYVGNVYNDDWQQRHVRNFLGNIIGSESQSRTSRSIYQTAIICNPRPLCQPRNYTTTNTEMNAKLKSLKERFRPARNNPVSPCPLMLRVALSRCDQNVETGRDALGLKELSPGHDPVIE